MNSSVTTGLPENHLFFASSLGMHVYISNGSQIYDIDPTTSLGDNDVLGQLQDLPGDLASHRYIGKEPLSPPSLYSISLNVAQACNMACTYCYADEGRFGGNSRAMSMHVAKRTVDQLFSEAKPGSDVVIGFMGGEPLINRSIVHDATKYAAKEGARLGIRPRFSITTNLTLLTEDDVRLFSEYPFSVCVSVDGTKRQTDAHRPMRGGHSSYDRLQTKLGLFESGGRPKHLSARMTVTKEVTDLVKHLDHVISLGFDEVGFSPVIASPIPGVEFKSQDMNRLLSEVIRCGEKALAKIVAGSRYPFGNFETAMQQIHRGTHRPYPCGAGAAYLSASAEGKLFACHRLIDDEEFAMGDVESGPDLQKRKKHLEKNFVDKIEPCKSCWARYMCGGGCYHEVARRGRVGCDYIRGWLTFCLEAYVELSDARPKYFELTNGHQDG